MNKSLGQIAYEAHVEASKNVPLGTLLWPSREYGQLTDEERSTWEAAAEAVTAALLERADGD